ncbi:carbohydrate-binding module family 13 protein [Cadophora sp. DSE1049]|nr:carbohydrate-binding module family 13 protein [Cadophora sp. DSE1049]
MMWTSSLFVLALAATGLAQVNTTLPAGYRKVYLTSMQDKKFVIVPKTPVKIGTTLVVQTLNNKPEQQWYIKDGNVTGKIQLADTTFCMDAGAQSNWKDMGPVSLQTCSDTAVAQQWVVMTDGRIALAPSPKPQQCLDLQYLRATANNPVGLYTCAGLGNTGAADKGINWPLLNATAT